MNRKITRQLILKKFRQMAMANTNKLPSRLGFTRETGIPVHKWRGVYWSRWRDALLEAGLMPHAQQRTDAQLLDEYGKYALKLKRLPTQSDLRMRSQERRTSKWYTYSRRFGGRTGLQARLLEHWRKRRGGKTIAGLCVSRRHRRPRHCQAIVEGYIYLIRCGKLYKIGKADSVEARFSQLASIVPDDLVKIHRIKTDDSFGVEAYWHKRFADKHVKGEWFKLNQFDVEIFRSRSLM